MTGFATRMASPSFFTLDGGGGVKKLDEPIEGHCFLHLQERVSVLILNNESRQSWKVKLPISLGRLTSLDSTQPF